jgi:hypothetical protein
MKTHSIVIMTGGKAIDSFPLDSVQMLRLRAFAKKNKRGLAEMADLAIRFAIAPEDRGPDLLVPEEEEIVTFAANLMQRNGLTASKSKRQ